MHADLYPVDHTVTTSTPSSQLRHLSHLTALRSSGSHAPATGYGAVARPACTAGAVCNAGSGTALSYALSPTPTTTHHASAVTRSSVESHAEKRFITRLQAHIGSASSQRTLR